MTTCKTAGCEDQVCARGLCKRCYNKQWRGENASYFQEYRRVHAAERAAYTKRWRAENSERWAEWWASYYSANKDRYAAHCANRSAKLRGEAFKERVSRKRLREMDGDNCCYCNVGLSFSGRARGEWIPNAAEVDHVVPLAHGGEHSYMNTALACATCNRAKGRSYGWTVLSGHRLAEIYQGVE
ncbi:HNH endonuclease [Leucobacter sp. NPDC077196]|uniref:HNH endonuclease n=1 Tax=Leucobacter sp. NPDC077196 TaxID=3154959 RepID=UPI003443F487